MNIIDRPIRSRLIDALSILGAAVLYAFLVRGILISFPTLDFTGVFHPWIGVALALMLRDRQRYLPGVFLGSIAVNAIINDSIVVGVPIAVSTTLAAISGAWLISRNSRFDANLNSLRNYLRLLILGGAVSGVIVAFSRAVVLLATGALPGKTFVGYLLHWWMGDALGIALVAPLILVCCVGNFARPKPTRVIEAAFLLGLTFLCGQIVFLDWFRDIIGKAVIGYWMFFFVAWVAVRLKTPGTAFVLMVTAVQALYGAYLNTGFFAGDIVATGLVNYWLYMMILSVVGMALATYVSERTRAEMQVRRITQLYAALSHCNQAIVRCASSEELLPEVCRIAVEFGGMKAAWIGMVDKENQQVHPVATNGFSMDLLRGLRISVDVADPRGRGPTGTVLRENQPFWSQDFQHDPRTAPWHDIGVRMKLAAMAAVPLTFGGRPIGAFSLYADRVNAFDEDERYLLVRIGLDISYALENYEREAERRRHEEILRGESLVSLSQRDNALREITQGVVITDAERKISYVNDAFTRQTGFAKEEVLGKSCGLLQGEETSADTVAQMRVRLNASLPFQGEILNYRKDGSPFWNDLSITPVFDGGGKLIQWVGVQRDISQQKQAEAQIRRLNQLYATLSHCNNAIVHCRSEQELFERICQVTVQDGAMKMAWIGMIDEARRIVIPVAHFGVGEGYLSSLKVNLNSDNGAELLLTASAILNNQPVWCQDFLSASIKMPWYEAAAEHSVLSMAALPLRKNGVVVGNFTLYADTTDAFDKEARHLLLEMAQDISFALENFEREAESKQAAAQLSLAASVFAQSSEAIVVSDANRNIVMVNKAFTDITGYAEAEVLGQKTRTLYSGFKSEELFKAILDSLSRIGHWQGEVWNRRKNGETYLEWLSVNCVYDADGQLTHFVGIFSDITQRKEAEERMHWLSHFDPLTGLPNRTLLEDRCRQAIGMAQSNGESLALMFLDLDHFKNINETIGHRIGDLLLVELANRLTFLARDQDTVSRFGGDDFVLALPGIDAGGAAHVAERVMGVIAHAFEIEEHELSISGSIGIAMYPVDGNDFDALVKCADMAMYRAKQDGRNNFRFFTAEIQAHSLRTLQMENALRRALERDQLTLHYQPQVLLNDGRIIGVEALLRWNHPDFGMVSPVEFIPIAESSGLILPIGEWVLRTAMSQLKAWIDGGLEPITMSVNLSAVQFRQPGLTQRVMQIVEESGVSPHSLELELTESVAMENPLTAIAVMDELNQRGIRIAIDDFGTGYSSLAHLKRFKVNKLKIDRSFVSDLHTNSEDKAIVCAVINLACSLGLRTIAEGVETEFQFAFLQANGCHEIQGYYFSRPLPSDQMEVLLRRRQAD